MPGSQETRFSREIPFKLSLPLGRVTSSVEAFFFSFSICKLSFVPHPQPRGPNHKSNLERFYDSGKVKVPVTQSCLSLHDSMDCSPSSSAVHGILQAKILEWVVILFPKIFPTQGSNPGLLHCRQILYSLSHLGSPGQSVRVVHNWVMRILIQ